MPNNISEQRKIEISELPSSIPDFSSSYEPKESIIKKWIVNWILSAVSNKKIKDNDIMPSKSELSNYLGVSIGTVQNAIRYVEDEGLLKSKQKLGTMISTTSNPISDISKLTSKRDKAVSAIKRVIIQEEIPVGKQIFSTRKMSEIINISQNTTRLAYEYLKSIGVLDIRQKYGNTSNWILKKIPDININEINKSDEIFADTLVDKLTENLKNYLSNSYKIGDKISSHEELAKSLNVSVKTIHDCIKQLNKEGIVISRRGQYGSILAKDPLNPLSKNLKENYIFSSAEDAAFYSYQKIESQIIDLINSKYNAGDKIPSMAELSKTFNVSTNTIRKALSSLEQEGYITFGRGRYGGTFVIEKPDNSNREQYQWLSINPDFV